MTLNQKVLVLLCFFISGATSLALQVAWSKELSYILGNTLYAVATVVAAFMAGLALGSGLAGYYAQKVRSPILAYAIMQWVIGACGILSIPLFRSTRPFFGLLYNSLEPGHESFLLLRFLAVFILMMIPVTVMGMTLPVVIGALGRSRKHYELEAGLIYGINTLGAVAGTVVAGFLLVSWLGLLKTCVLVGAADIVIGFVALWVHRYVGRIEYAAPEAHQQREGIVHLSGILGWSYLQKFIGVIFFVSGMVALVYEIAWFRLLALILGPTVHAFSMMLAIFLAGIGLGSVVGARWSERTRNPLMMMAILEVLIGAATLMTMFFYNDLAIWYGKLFWTLAGGKPSAWYIIAQGLTAIPVVLPATFIMGLLFPITVRAFREAHGDEMHPEPAVGGLYVLNTTGGIIGSLAAGFWLVPGIGMWKTVLLSSGVSVLLGCMLWVMVRGLALPRKAAAITASGVALVFLMTSVPQLDMSILNKGMFRWMRHKETFEKLIKNKPGGDEQILYFKEGVNSTIAVVTTGGVMSFKTSGITEASTHFKDRYSLFFLGHLPVLFAPDNSNVAVIGFGMGISSGSILRHSSVKSLDIIEIEKSVLGAAHYFEYFNDNPFDDPRTRVILEDARIHITYTDKVYDVITSDPVTPYAAGLGNLYTVDFYDLVRQRLSPGGVFCQWIQLSGMSEVPVKTILASMQKVFPYVELFFAEHDAVVLASDRPIEIPWDKLSARIYDKDVYEHVKDYQLFTPYDVLYFYGAGARQVEAYTKDVQPLNTDDNVWLEHHMPYEFYTVDPLVRLIPILTESFAEKRFEDLLKLVPDLPVAEAVDMNIMYPYIRELSEKDRQIWHLPRVEGMKNYFLQKGDVEMADRVSAGQQKAEADLDYRIKMSLSLISGLGSAAGKLGISEKVFQEAVKFPSFSSYVAGIHAFNEKKYDEAERYLRHLLDYPWNAWYYNGTMHLALSLHRQGRTDEALGFTSLLQRRYPNFSAAFLAEAEILSGQGKNQEALKAVENGLFYNPTDAKLLAMSRSL